MAAATRCTMQPQMNARDPFHSLTGFHSFIHSSAGPTGCRAAAKMRKKKSATIRRLHCYPHPLIDTLVFQSVLNSFENVA